MSRYAGTIVDVDIHHNPRTDLELLDYLPARSRKYGEACAAQGIPFDPTGLEMSSTVPYRFDTLPPDGAVPASSYELVRDQLLDEYGVWRALLTHNLGMFGSNLNPHWAADVCRAANDWNAEHWLARDPRLYSGILVSARVPEEAVSEIRRLASHPQMACVFVNGNPLGRPLGDPLYHPIYAAAAEVGLPIATHFGHPYPHSSVAGPVSTGTESNAASAGDVAHHVSSMIVHGVFERFSQLRVLIIEYALSWLPSLLWNLDREFDLLRLESPWVKRLPSEYVREHIKLSTQPVETTATNHRQLVQLLDTVDGIEDLLCFSSDYPHYTMDDPLYVMRVMPAAWHRKLFCDNACTFFGWTPPDTVAAERKSAGVVVA